MHANGMMSSVAHYLEGRPNGRWIGYYTNGETLHSGHYKNGARYGCNG